ncbi:hypothetical protein BaRGS_00018060 [Batillaria attramentaria]|uniref:Secreted protein n=1 Tax=Batillaria attramentaria TaxID=370345 RepID=A0ABD0KTR2_9CAEN
MTGKMALGSCISVCVTFLGCALRDSCRADDEEREREALQSLVILVSPGHMVRVNTVKLCTPSVLAGHTEVSLLVLYQVKILRSQQNAPQSTLQKTAVSEQ